MSDISQFTDESFDRFSVEQDSITAHAVAIARSRQIADADNTMFRAANSGGVCAATAARLRGVPGASHGVSSGSIFAVHAAGRIAGRRSRCLRVLRVRTGSTGSPASEFFVQQPLRRLVVDPDRLA